MYEGGQDEFPRRGLAIQTIEKPHWTSHNLFMYSDGAFRGSHSHSTGGWVIRQSRNQDVQASLRQVVGGEAFPEQDSFVAEARALLGGLRDLIKLACPYSSSISPQHRLSSDEWYHLKIMQQQ